MATIKQKKAFKEVVKGSSLTKAMKAVGYSEETSKRTNKLTATKGWKELMEKHLPDSVLAQKHRELLNKKEVITKNNNKTGEIEVVPTGEIDPTAVKNALDMAYKLKGAYAPDKSLSVNINADIISNEKLEEIAQQLNEIARNNSGDGQSSDGVDTSPVGGEV